MSFWKPGSSLASFDRDELRSDFMVDGTTIDDGSNGLCEGHIGALYGGVGGGAGMGTRAIIQAQRQRLPIFQHKRELFYLLETFRVVILVGQTGCGKTTQVPQYVLEWLGPEGSGMVACTQPRRVAATSVATRVAVEMETEVGGTDGLVGYSVRFEERKSPKSRILYMTDGMLFREAMSDPLLSRYHVIMLDEAHERTIHTELLCGLLKKIMKLRPDLRLIVSSATLDAQIFCDYFQDAGWNAAAAADDNDANLKQRASSAAILSVEGRLHAIEPFYLEQSCKDHVEMAVEAVLSIHQSQGDGDILVFLTGREDIERVSSLLRSEEKLLINKEGLKLYSLPLFAGLSLSSQMKVFEATPHQYRKVILSTNIAEASVTIDNIVYVVDSGLVKMKFFDPKSDLDSLQIVKISKAAALQRAGRAGRVRSGKVFRLYSEDEFTRFLDNTVPEIQRSNLVPIILQLKALGIDNLAKFHFVTSPPLDNMKIALELLFCLGAINEFGKLTDPLGLQMAEFPVDPKISKMILSSVEFYCTVDALSIAAMLSVDNIWILPGTSTSSSKDRNAFEEARSKFAVEEGDHLTYLNVYRAFTQQPRDSKWCSQHHLNYKALQRAVSIRYQLSRYAKKFALPLETCKVDTIYVRKCIIAGFFGNAAELCPDGSYQSIRDGTILYIHPNSVLFRRAPLFVIYNDVIETTKSFMREVTAIDPSWLAEVVPSYYQYGYADMGDNEQ